MACIRLCASIQMLATTWIAMAPEYGVEAIIGSLKTLYADYISVYTQINNIGGLVRKILMERAEYGLLFN